MGQLKTALTKGLCYDMWMVGRPLRNWVGGGSGSEEEYFAASMRLETRCVLSHSEESLKDPGSLVRVSFLQDP